MSLGTYKVVLLGEGRVGKTSIASRFVDDKFDSGQISTVQANMYSKKRIPVDGTLSAGKSGEKSKGRKYVDIALWDTAGQERYHALGPIYYRNANGAVLVYDITDADTFERIRMWIKELRQVVGENIHIVICGNKSDLEKEREVNLAMAEKFSKQQGATHFSTSAKTNEGVNEAFQSLVQNILESLGLVDAEGGATGGDGGEGDGNEDDEVPMPRGAKKGGKKATSPTTKRGGVKIALDGDEDESGAAAAEADDFPTVGKKSSSSSSKKKGLKIADDENDESTKPSASGYGYDDYGSYGVSGGSSSTANAGGYGDDDYGSYSAKPAGTSGERNSAANKGSTNSSAKPAPPQARKGETSPPAADTGAANSGSKKQPITLEDPKKKGGKGDGKKKDGCPC